MLSKERSFLGWRGTASSNNILSKLLGVSSRQTALHEDPGGSEEPLQVFSLGTHQGGHGEVREEDARLFLTEHPPPH